jgi:hypothetical protein
MRVVKALEARLTISDRKNLPEVFGFPDAKTGGHCKNLAKLKEPEQ